MRDPNDIKQTVQKLQQNLLVDGVRHAASALARELGETPPHAALRDKPRFERLLDRRREIVEARFAGLVDVAPEGVALLDARGRISYANRRFGRMVGLGSEDLAGRDIAQFLPNPIVVRLMTLMMETGGNRADLVLDAPLHLPDGSEVPVEVLAGGLDSEGEPGMALFLRDISLRKAAERRLLRREGRFRNLLDTAPDALLVCNRRGRIVLANRAAAELFGIAADQLTGQGISSLVPDGLYEQVSGDGLPGGSDSLASAGRLMRFTARRGDGGTCPVDVALALTQGENGALVTIALRDMSEAMARDAANRAEQRRDRDLVDALPDPVLAVRADGRIVLANAEACRKLGYARERLVGSSIAEILPEGVVDRLDTDPLRAVEDRLAQDMGMGLELYARHADGALFPVEVMLGRLQRHPDPLILMTLRDITLRRQLEVELVAGTNLATGETPAPPPLAEAGWMFTVINTISEAVLVLDRSLRITSLNKAAAELTGYESGDLEGRPLENRLGMLDATTRRPVSLLTGDPNKHLVLMCSDGREIAVAARLVVLGEAPAPKGYALLLHEREAIGRAEANEQSARHDYLTGLPNRLLLNDRISQAIAGAPRHRKKVAVMFIDLDGFKHVNDSLGHAIGDKLLQSVAKRLVACVRAADTVCRLGGDEFVILLPQVEQSDDAAILARRVLRAVSDPHDIDGNRMRLSASIGVSLYPDDGRDGETLLRHADLAMYQSKETGRNTFRYFTPELNERAAERQAMERRLREALDQHEFAIHYQPKVSLRTGEIAGAEALLRWPQREGDPLRPDTFLPIAETSGLIQPIGKWVLRQACLQTRAWLDAGLRLPRIAINVSDFEFRNECFLEGVFSALDESRLPPDHLELEFTESVLMKHAAQSDTTLMALTDRGVRLSVDDFGTGYTSLSHLSRFPIDTIKIDRSFVNRIGAEQEGRGVVSAALNLAKTLKLRCVAEGVETPEELAFLQAHQCELAQGHYFSPPLPARQFGRLLQTGMLDTMAARRQRMS